MQAHESRTIKLRGGNFPGFTDTTTASAADDVLDTLTNAVLHSHQGRHSMLKKRTQTILNLIVGDYISRAVPVASEVIARGSGLGVSPATVRSAVSELELKGFVTRPHPSAGSVPLDKGYRVYVETAAGKDTSIAQAETDSIRARLNEVERDPDGWTSTAAAALVELAGNLAIVTSPRGRETRVKRIEIVELQDLLVLLIVVFEQARLRRQLVRLSERIERAELQSTANRVNEMLLGLSWREIESIEMGMSSFEKDIVATTALVAQEEDLGTHQEHYLDGLRSLLSQPEFAENQKARDVIERAEDGTLAQAILGQAPDSPQDVKVVIGKENREDMLWPLGLVIGQYGVAGESVGTIGAVGPVRMDYKKTIACVELVAGVMSEMTENVTSG